jgi:putative N6-adenine-specific DNA methylase
MMNAVALCAVGAEKVVSNELRKLDLKVLDAVYGKVSFAADTAGLYRALIGLRAADRVLLEAAYFKAEDFDALFEGAGKVEWEWIVPKGMGLVVTKVRTNRSRINAETTIQSMVHKAAAQRLCEKYKMNRLPVDRCVELRVYVEKDMVSLLVDLSGEPLFKRGYRGEGGVAPLRETTAAAILLLSGWKRKIPLYDPFCGSGTILTEALMYAWDMAPGLSRSFALSTTLLADNQIEQEVRNAFRARVDFSRLVRIAGSDADQRSVSIASSNIARLQALAKSPADTVINLKVCSMKEASSKETSSDSEGLILTNPPYGKRLGDKAQSEQIYRDMAGLAEGFAGWKLAVISDHSGFEAFFGKMADSCREISNGAIPSFFYQYEVL